MKMTTYYIGVKKTQRGNASGYTGYDYAMDVADEINRKAACLGEDTEKFFERELASASECIGFELLRIESEEIEVGVDDE
jgi:hypothetical protein